MRILHRPAVRFLAAAALAGALTACGENGPSGPFDAAGTSADIGTMQGMFATSSFNSFSGLSSGMDAVLGGSVTASIAAVPQGTAAARGPIQDAPGYVRQLTALLPHARAAGLSASSGAIPASALGKTFLYDETGGQYVVSDRTGAPSDGVRFVLYAVDPLTHQPVSPLSETGYVDVIDHSGSNDVDVRVLAVSGSTTFIDYAITASGGTSGGNIRVQGFVSDLTDRADFDLKTGVSISGSDARITLDYDLSVPSRDAELSFTLHVETSGTNAGSGDVSLLMQGPHGKVEMEGDFGETTGTLAVKVNGDDFATVTLTGDFDPTVTDAAGEPLTDQERAAIEQIARAAGNAFSVIEQLMAPADALINL